MRTITCVVLFGAFGLWAQTKVQDVAMQQTAASSGVQMFKAYCASCHGTDGTGDGPAASALKKAPANLTLLARNNGGKFPADMVGSRLRLSEESAHGSADMPVWGPLLTSVSRGDQSQAQLRISNIVSYIESIQAK